MSSVTSPLVFFLSQCVLIAAAGQGADELVSADRVKVDVAGFPGWNGKLRFAGYPWKEFFELAARDRELGNIIDGIVRAGRGAAQKGVRRRPMTIHDAKGLYSDLQLKGSGKKREVSALAYADCSLGNFLFSGMTAAAVAARHTGDAGLKKFVLDQLEETSGWRPLQRPGWTLYTPGGELPARWKGDGVWLATGWGLVGLVTIMDVMGPEIPAALRTRLLDLMQREVDAVQSDFRSGLPWYVRSKQYNSNQWAFPLIGSVYACMYMGEEKNRAAYEDGILGLAKTCLSQGNDGSWTEGYAYARMTMDLLARAVHALKLSGDGRLAQLPLMSRFSFWYGQMQMPGRRHVYAFDGSGMSGERSFASGGFTNAVLVAGDAGGMWMMREIFKSLPNSIDGIIYRYYTSNFRPDSLAPPKTFGFFPASQILTWRTDWTDGAFALWIRGNSMNDFHSHRDAGQVTVYAGLRPVLVEAGCPAYGTADLESSYAGQKGHGILQTAGVKDRRVQARCPILVQRLDEAGGDVRILGHDAYSDVEKWVRRVVWKRGGELTISDEAVLSARGAKPEGDEWFRFHTGATEPIGLQKIDDRRWRAEWPAATLEFTARQPIVLDQVPWPNVALRKIQCLTVKCTVRGARMDLETVVRVRK